MITFTDVQCGDAIEKLSPFELYPISFYGSAVDERGRATIDFLHSRSMESKHLEYDFTKFNLLIDNTSWRINQLDQYVKTAIAPKVLLDATTLNCIELALIIRAYMDAQEVVEFDILYAEPGGYAARCDESDISNNHTFQLSSNLLEESFTVPGFKPLLKSDKEAHVIIVAGFEKERLGALLNGLESHHVKECTLIFGIPPFQPSMEIHSLMQNSALIDNKAIQTIDFIGANNPISTFRTIKRIKESLSDTEILELAPIGPKPSTLACALYAAHDKSVGLRYDFPKPAIGRTIGIGRSCLYSILKS
jgi:hypothetical protein